MLASYNPLELFSQPRISAFTSEVLFQDLEDLFKTSVVNVTDFKSIIEPLTSKNLAPDFDREQFLTALPNCTPILTHNNVHPSIATLLTTEDIEVICIFHKAIIDRLLSILNSEQFKDAFIEHLAPYYTKFGKLQSTCKILIGMKHAILETLPYNEFIRILKVIIQMQSISLNNLLESINNNASLKDSKWVQDILERITAGNLSITDAQQLIDEFCAQPSTITTSIPAQTTTLAQGWTYFSSGLQSVVGQTAAGLARAASAALPPERREQMLNAAAAARDATTSMVHSAASAVAAKTAPTPKK